MRTGNRPVSNGVQVIFSMSGRVHGLPAPTGSQPEWFSDSSIVEQDSAMIKNGDHRTNGISLHVKCVPDVDTTEVLLDYEELKKAIAYLEKDREAMPHLYSSNK